jgi:hypothetical protein
MLPEMMARRISGFYGSIDFLGLVLLDIEGRLDSLGRLVVRFGNIRGLVLIAAANASRSGGSWCRGSRILSRLLCSLDS